MPLQDMLHGYRLGARVAWQALTEQATAPEEQRVLLDIAARIMKYVDGVSSAVSQAYLDEREQLVSERERWVRALLDGLLDPSTPAEDLRRLADKTGLDLAETYRPLRSASRMRRRGSTRGGRSRCAGRGSSRSPRATG